MGKRVNKTAKFTVSIDLTNCGLTSGELVLNMEVRHPKVLTSPLGLYSKKVKVDLTKMVTNATIAD
jgi:hypothetical protein